MSVRHFRRQRKGVYQMGHVPSYLRGAAPPPVFDQLYLVGTFDNSVDFESRVMAPAGPNIDNVFLGRWAADTGVGQWVTRAYPNVGGRACDLAAVGSGDQLYWSFPMFPNVTAVTPITYTVENSDGTVGATVDTSANQAGGGSFHDEACLAALDTDGNVLWAKLAYELATPFPRTQRLDRNFTSIIPPVDPASPVIRVIGRILNTSAADATTDVYRFGPGDPNEQTATFERRLGYTFTYQIDKTNGEIVANSLIVLGITTASNVPLNIFQRLLRGDRGQERGGDLVISPFLSLTNQTTNVASVNTQGTPPPTAFQKPSAPSVHDGYLTRVNNADRSVDFAFSVAYTGGAGTGNNETSRGVILRSSGDVVCCAHNYVTTAGDIVFRDIAGASVASFTRGQRGDAYFFSYDSAGNFRWFKEIRSNVALVSMFIEYTMVEMTGPVVAFEHAYLTAGTCTWGVGEPNQTVYAFPNSGRNSAIVCFDPADGSLIFAQPIAIAVGGRVDILEIFERDGKIRALVAIGTGATLDPLNTATLVSPGAGNSEVIEVTYAFDGTYESHQSIWTYPSADAFVDLSQSGVQ